MPQAPDAKKPLAKKAVAKKVTPIAEKATKPAKAPKEAAAPKIRKPYLDSLKALQDGKEHTHAEIAAVTGREKGNCLREMDKDGLVTTKAPAEGEGRGNTYIITPAGRALLEANS